MRRGAPRWFTETKAKEHLHTLWPWVLSGTCAGLYFFNREPFDEAVGAVVTKIRKPLLKTMEWIEVHDVDPETMALELPPDMIFGPLEFPKQMRFLLAALKADNELADGYLARLIIDYMDLSLDPPILKEEDFLAAGAKELLDFSIDDFTNSGTRKSRKHIFFQPDQFLQLVNWISAYPKLTEYFINEKNGVELILLALRHAESPYSRVFAARALTLSAFTQKTDGTVERKVMQANGVKALVDSYKQSTGDPTDTRFVTLLLSSIMRHFPKEGGQEFLEAEGVEAAVNNLNISRYKGVPQHIRVLHDAQKLPKEAVGGTPVNQRIEDAEFLGVAMGIIETFPEFYEATGDLLRLVLDVVPSCTQPLELLEYRAMPVLSKYYVRWKDDVSFQTDGTRALVARLFEMMLNDRTCKRCYDPSVASPELLECLRTANHAVAEERKYRESLQARKVAGAPQSAAGAPSSPHLAAVPQQAIA